jgi:uncharacterized membrane protein
MDLPENSETSSFLQTWSDEQVEQFLGTLLRTGVLLAGTVVLIGGILYLIRHGGAIPDYRVFRGEPDDLRSVEGIVRNSFLFSSRGLIQLGLLLLIATPLLRVIFSVGAFALQRDLTYVLITLIVLGILLYSLSGRAL